MGDLCGATLFGRVGEQDLKTAQFIQHKEVRYYFAQYYERFEDNFDLERRNEMSMHMFSRRSELLEKWEGIGAAVGEMVVPAVDRRFDVIKSLFPSEADAALFHVKRQIVMMCIEREFQSLVRDSAFPVYFGRLTDIYLGGHLSCGWRGRYPLGRPTYF